MTTELEEATRLIDELVGLDRFEVVCMPSKDSRARLYGARELVPMTVGAPPVVIADKRGVRLLDHKKWHEAWKYADEHGLEPPLWVWERACDRAKELGMELPKRSQP